MEKKTIETVCAYCKNKTMKSVSRYNYRVRHGAGLFFCNQECNSLYQKQFSKKQIVICNQCGKEFLKRFTEIKKNRKNFCCCSCNATYKNNHKTTGYRRSKLESFIEERLKKEYPTLIIECNNNTAINSELDIYIPSLRLAFELNGVFHYEPIFGEDKLKSIQNNDERKFQACIENNIELCIIDSSTLKYHKEANALKYYRIVKDIIDKKLLI